MHATCVSHGELHHLVAAATRHEPSTYCTKLDLLLEEITPTKLELNTLLRPLFVVSTTA